MAASFFLFSCQTTLTHQCMVTDAVRTQFLQRLLQGVVTFLKHFLWFQMMHLITHVGTVWGVQTEQTTQFVPTAPCFGKGCVHDSGTHGIFKHLPAIHAFFHGPARDETVTNDVSQLTNAITSVDRLPINGRVPTWIKKNHSIRARQSQTYPPHPHGQQHHVNVGVHVEFVHQHLPILQASAPVDS